MVYSKSTSTKPHLIDGRAVAHDQLPVELAIIDGTLS
jgi:hypothetical protein